MKNPIQAQQINDNITRGMDFRQKIINQWILFFEEFSIDYIYLPEPLIEPLEFMDLVYNPTFYLPNFDLYIDTRGYYEDDLLTSIRTLNFLIYKGRSTNEFPLRTDNKTEIIFKQIKQATDYHNINVLLVNSSPQNTVYMLYDKEWQYMYFTLENEKVTIQKEPITYGLPKLRSELAVKYFRTPNRLSTYFKQKE